MALNGRGSPDPNKRSRMEDDESIPNYREYRLAERGRKRRAVECLESLGFEGALRDAEGGPPEEVVARLCALSGITPTDSLSTLVDRLETHLCSGVRSPALTEAVATITERCAANPQLQGRAASLLSRAPLTSQLRSIQPQRTATEEAPSSPVPSGTDPETVFLQFMTKTVQYTREHLDDFLACVQAVATQVGRLVAYPHFTMCLSRANEGPRHQHVASTGARSALVADSKGQSQILLQALVRCHAVLNVIMEGLPSNTKKPPPEVAILSKAMQAVVSGLARCHSSTPRWGVGVTTECMREGSWRAWKADGYPTIVRPSCGAPRSNTLVLPRKCKFPITPKVPEVTEYLQHGTTQPVEDHPSVTCDTFLVDASIALNPENGIEKEYWPSKNPLYVWRGARLMLRELVKYPAEVWLTSEAGFEGLVTAYWPNLTRPDDEDEDAMQ